VTKASWYWTRPSPLDPRVRINSEIGRSGLLKDAVHRGLHSGRASRAASADSGQGERLE